MTLKTAIVWFRRDLRLHDHPALTAALQDADRIVPLFVLDNALLEGRFASPNRTAFMLECLRSLDVDLRARGGRLVWRRGRPQNVVPVAAEEFGATDVFVSRDYSPYSRRRDAAIATQLRLSGVAFHGRTGVLVHEPESVLTTAGSPYGVFTPFRRTWEERERRPVLPAPDHVSMPPGLTGAAIPNLTELGVDSPKAAEMLLGGEDAARHRLDDWLAGIDAYGEERDRMDLDGTSRLSQDLRWGLLSPNEVVERCKGPSVGRSAFVSEICWRDFYYHVLHHNPRVARESYQRQYANLRWNDDAPALSAWQEGRTGYPIVDAAMRQLVSTGWMHNRARMIVASFLTKDLLLDWREGERFFMRHLVDGDLASNNGGWQWAASTGTDPQPYFRIFNPVLQGQRFDPEGAFVRRWLPELKDVPTKYIHVPWSMPMDVQASAGCTIGRDYPTPVIDHAVARRRALEAYGVARDG